MRKYGGNRRSESEVARLEALLTAHLEADGTAKAFSSDTGLSMSWVYIHAAQLGFATMYLSKHERAMVMTQRRQQKRAA